MSDLFDDPELEKYLEHAKTEMFPKLKSSAISLTILSDNPDPKLCLEVGASILFDKPIIVVVPPGRGPVPNNLRRVASLILEGDMKDPGFYERLMEGINNVIDNDERSKKMKA